jgi:tripartite-type tricarboxylate transporter receptor subunit TctC
MYLLLLAWRCFIVKKLLRFYLFIFVLLFSCASLMAGPAIAGEFPSKPITIVVPYSAGGGTDVIIRAVTSVAEDYFPQPLVVLNKPGGGGAVGTAFAAQAKPDGYTILFAVPAVIVIKPYMVETPYTFEDLEPLIGVSDSPRILMAGNHTPWKNLSEMVSYAKENPGEVTYSSAGTGTSTHIALEGMAYQAGIKMTHIPFPGCADAVSAVLGGHTDIFGAIPSECMQYFKSGDAWPVAVFTQERLEELPDTPTLIEEGIDFLDSSTRAIFVPKDVPQDRRAILVEGFQKTLADPKLVELFARLQEKPVPTDGETLKSLLTKQKDLYGEVLEQAGLKNF